MIICVVIFISFRVYLLVYVCHLIRESVSISCGSSEAKKLFTSDSRFTSGSEMDLFDDLPEPANDPGRLFHTNNKIIRILYALYVLK